ncbi:MAG: outer membrane protein assembly factor BamD [Myxococcales bacterium]|nr:outer membrane protein assembly factor BamD [Myxococcales bacterium]MCB9533053.1 outer membrane protein assembly factor BamD [Myxococcales bacterium]
MTRLAARVALMCALPLAVPSLTACGAKQTTPSSYTEAAQVAYESAEQAFDRKDYELARSRFTEVFQAYPYSEYAALAELRVGDTYIRDRSYARAIESYRRFVRSHPTHAQVPEAQYKIALAYVEQMPRDVFIKPPAYERDLSDTENAARALEQFLTNYSDSEYAESARTNLARTTERLAGYELYVAEFYTRQHNPRGAAMRCEHLLAEYPLSEEVPRALFLYGRALADLGDIEAARVPLQRLVEEYPDDARVGEATRWLASTTE